MSDAQIKCIKFTKQITALQIIQQIFMAHLMSALHIGPKIEKVNGFDFVFSFDCIQFGMEVCKQLKNLQDCDKELRLDLLRMHSLNICHIDIKPMNIMYSPAYQKHIFIDFGLTSLFQRNIGIRTWTFFEGNFYNQFEEMNKVKTKGGYVDMFTNDKVMLQSTLSTIEKIMNTKQKNMKFEKRINQKDQSNRITIKEHQLNSQKNSFKRTLDNFLQQFNTIKSKVGFGLMTFKDELQLKEDDLELNNKQKKLTLNYQILTENELFIQNAKFIIYIHKVNLNDQFLSSFNDDINIKKAFSQIKRCLFYKEITNFENSLDYMTLEEKSFNPYKQDNQSKKSKSKQQYFNNQQVSLIIQFYAALFEKDLRSRIKPFTQGNSLRNNGQNQTMKILLSQDKTQQHFIKQNKIEQYIIKVFLSTSIIRTHHQSLAQECLIYKKEHNSREQISDSNQLYNLNPNHRTKKVFNLSILQKLQQNQVKYKKGGASTVRRIFNSIAHQKYPIYFKGEQMHFHYLQKLALSLKNQNKEPHTPMLKSKVIELYQNLVKQKCEFLMPYSFEILKNFIIAKRNYFQLISHFLSIIILYFSFDKPNFINYSHLILIFVKESIQIGFLINHNYIPITKNSSEDTGFFPQIFLNPNLLKLSNEIHSELRSKGGKQKKVSDKLRLIQKFWVFYNYQMARINLTKQALIELSFQIRKALKKEFEELDPDKRFDNYGIYAQVDELIKIFFSNEFINQNEQSKISSVQYAIQDEYQKNVLRHKFTDQVSKCYLNYFNLSAPVQMQKRQEKGKLAIRSKFRIFRTIFDKDDLRYFYDSINLSGVRLAVRMMYKEQVKMMYNEQVEMKDIMQKVFNSQSSNLHRIKTCLKLADGFYQRIENFAEIQMISDTATTMLKQIVVYLPNIAAQLVMVNSDQMNSYIKLSYLYIMNQIEKISLNAFHFIFIKQKDAYTRTLDEFERVVYSTVRKIMIRFEIKFTESHDFYQIRLLNNFFKLYIKNHFSYYRRSHENHLNYFQDSSKDKKQKNDLPKQLKDVFFQYKRVKKVYKFSKGMVKHEKMFIMTLEKTLLLKCLSLVVRNTFKQKINKLIYLNNQYNKQSILQQKCLGCNIQNLCISQIRYQSFRNDISKMGQAIIQYVRVSNQLNRKMHRVQLYSDSVFNHDIKNQFIVQFQLFGIKASAQQIIQLIVSLRAKVVNQTSFLISLIYSSFIFKSAFHFYLDAQFKKPIFKQLLSNSLSSQWLKFDSLTIKNLLLLQKIDAKQSYLSQANLQANQRQKFSDRVTNSICWLLRELVKQQKYKNKLIDTQLKGRFIHFLHQKMKKFNCSHAAGTRVIVDYSKSVNDRWIYHKKLKYFENTLEVGSEVTKEYENRKEQFLYLKRRVLSYIEQMRRCLGQEMQNEEKITIMEFGQFYNNRAQQDDGKQCANSNQDRSYVCFSSPEMSKVATQFVQYIIQEAQQLYNSQNVDQFDRVDPSYKDQLIQHHF